MSLVPIQEVPVMPSHPLLCPHLSRLANAPPMNPYAKPAGVDHVPQDPHDKPFL
jgi:hypothetical protein